MHWQKAGLQNNVIDTQHMSLKNRAQETTKITAKCKTTLKTMKVHIGDFLYVIFLIEFIHSGVFISYSYT